MGYYKLKKTNAQNFKCKVDEGSECDSKEVHYYNNVAGYVLLTLVKNSTRRLADHIPLKAKS